MSSCKVLNNGDTYRDIRCNINENFENLEKKIDELVVYTDVTQLGLTAPCTVVDICNALEVGEKFKAYNDTATVSGIPKIYIAGELSVYRPSTNIYNIEFRCDDEVYLGDFVTDTIEWNKVVKENEMAKVITSIGDLGLSTPCTTLEIVDALEALNRAVKFQVTASNTSITDLPMYGTLRVYIPYNGGETIIELNREEVFYRGEYTIDYIVWHKYVFEDKVVTEITDSATDNEIPTALAVKNLIDNGLFEVVGTGEIDSHDSGEQTTTRYIHEAGRGLFLIALHNTSIPEDGYYFFMNQGQSGELHRIAGDDSFSKATIGAGPIDGAFRVYLDFYSNEASKMVYKIYKLPFFGL